MGTPTDSGHAETNSRAGPQLSTGGINIGTPRASKMGNHAAGGQSAGKASEASSEDAAYRTPVRLSPVGL